MRSKNTVVRTPYIFTSLAVRVDSIDLTRRCSDETVLMVVVARADSGEVVDVFAQGDLDLHVAARDYLGEDLDEVARLSA